MQCRNRIFGAELGRIMKEQEGAKIVAVLDPENGQTIADELGVRRRKQTWIHYIVEMM